VRIVSFTIFQRKSVSLIVLATFVALLFFWTTPAPADSTIGNSKMVIGQGNSGGPGFIEHESKLEPVIKKERKFPWLIVGLGIVAVGIAVYFLVIKKSKYTLTVNMSTGAQGTPASGTHAYKKGQTVAYRYQSSDGYKIKTILLDGQEVPAEGTIAMDKDHRIEVAAVDIVDKNAVKILFIGSSYLGYFNLTDMFYNLAVEKSKNILIDTRIVYGQDLSVLSSDSETIKKIFERKWDYVILQGVSHTISEEKWHYLIVPYIISLKNTITSNCAETKTVYMMGWGYKDGLQWIAGETEDYFELQTNICNQSVRFAKENNFSIAPVGWAWYQVIKEKPEIELFGPDLNHQTLAGAYLSACVFYATIFKEPLNAMSYKAGLESELAFYLQRIASETVLDDLEKWNLK
jgi:hypothetical protein